MRPEQAPRRQANRVNRPAGGTLSATMFEQPINTRFPGQQFPVGSVVTFLDRHRRTVFPAVTELRRHEAIVAGGETGRWRVRYAGLRLIKAGPTGGATMQQVELSVSFVLRATWSEIRDTLLHEIAHAIVGPGHGHDALWQTAARRIGCTEKRCST